MIESFGCSFDLNKKFKKITFSNISEKIVENDDKLCSKCLINFFSLIMIRTLRTFAKIP